MPTDWEYSATGGASGPKVIGTSDDWTLEADVGEDGRGRMVITALSIRRGDGGDRGVDARLLRSVRVGEVLGAVRAEVQSGASVSGADWLAQAAVLVQGDDTVRNRRGYPERFYRWVAIAYLGLQDRDAWIEQAGPKKAAELTSIHDRIAWLLRQGVAQFWLPEADRDPKRDTVRTWVKKATELGYLMPGHPGRSDRRPGPKLTVRTGSVTDEPGRTPSAEATNGNDIDREDQS